VLERKPPVPTFAELKAKPPAKKPKTKLAENVYSVTCMPNAYPNAIKSIETIYKVFSQMYIDSKIEGTLNEFVCDFIQDEHGRFHFLKIASFKTDGVPICNTDWKLSSKYTDRV